MRKTPTTDILWIYQIIPVLTSTYIPRIVLRGMRPWPIAYAIRTSVRRRAKITFTAGAARPDDVIPLSVKGFTGEIEGI